MFPPPLSVQTTASLVVKNKFGYKQLSDSEGNYYPDKMWTHGQTNAWTHGQTVILIHPLNFITGGIMTDRMGRGKRGRRKDREGVSE